MREDPVVEELHRIREEIAAEFDFDLDAIYRDGRKREEELRKDGWNVASLPAREPKGGTQSAA